ncbi:CPBP family intramembrane metalloprotease [Nonomuraea sp. K274]|uniref:CPBP family intramembrane metalloprotease n=1 Tax=Nonomuraea cypriaca TaxID=1187855 RepID=A0A931ADM2_9ACTN|nr:CPBP family intramembrane glutamic endopeptidase [Nonomuraea cypriaca]MBF8189675.1 CPBP family intramembrane metalloprotease [Nonomuraea cypriaca]
MRFPWTYFLLVAALSLPIYVLSPFVHGLGMPKNMPVLDAVLAFVPFAAAAILTHRREGFAGVGRLLRRAVDFRRIRPVWYLPVLLLGPVTLLLTYGLMRLFDVRLPGQPQLPVVAMLVLPLVFLLAAAGEELGWTGYAADRLRERYGLLAGSLVLGVVWWAWHLPSIVVSGQPPVLVALGALTGVCGRVIWMWIYAGTRSVAAIVVVHAVANVCASYVPSVPTAALGPVTTVLAIACVLGSRRWGRPAVPG